MLVQIMLYVQDKGLRELAATALSLLVKFEPDYFANIVLEKLVPCTLSSDLCMRHGATLAIGEVVLALHKHNYAISTGKSWCPVCLEIYCEYFFSQFSLCFFLSAFAGTPFL